MADDALTIAKEITVAVVPKVRSISRPDLTGEAAGRVFKAVLKQVMQAIKEAGSS